MAEHEKHNLDLNFLDEAPSSKKASGEGPKKAAAHKKERSCSSATKDSRALWTAGAVLVGVLIIGGAAALGSSDGQVTETYTGDTFTPSTKEVAMPSSEEINRILLSSDSSDPADVEIEDPLPTGPTGWERCQQAHGFNATYDDSTGTCGCAEGYSFGEESNQCVGLIAYRNESCSAEWPNTSFLKYDSASGKNICDCKAGYYWNNAQTACYSLIEFNQGCKNSYGAGSYSTTENGKRVCDCGYGYSWNIDRDQCVSTASINEICERDVGRNSRYAGTVSDGKYNCTTPY